MTALEFEKFLDGLSDETAYQTAVYARGAVDLEFFSGYFFAHYCQHPFNEFHHAYFKTVKFGERKIRRADAAPRGYAKSVLKALIKPIHDLCYGLESYIVIFSNTETQAIGKLRDIRNELLENRKLIDFYGISFARKAIAEGSFVAYCDKHSVKFEGYGTGAQIRGLRHGAARPSKLILDDVEHSEEVENEMLREKYAAWAREDVGKMGDENTNIEFVGTILHRKSLLSEALENPMYESKKYKAVINWSEREDLWELWRKILYNIDNPSRLIEAQAYYEANKTDMLQGVQVLWPEKEPYIDLMKELAETGRRAFMKEKQNEPLGNDQKIFQTFHWYYEDTLNGEKGVYLETTKKFIPLSYLRTYGVMDPATGQTKAKAGTKGDWTCILTGHHEPNGRLLVHHDWTRREAPSKYIEQLFVGHDEFQYEKFGVETNLYRNLLMPNILSARKALEEKRGKTVKIPFYEIEQVENKQKRIYTLEPKLTNGWIVLNRNLSKEFKDQLEDFPKADHDDCPDSLEMLYALVNNRIKTQAVTMNASAGR